MYETDWSTHRHRKGRRRGRRADRTKSTLIATGALAAVVGGIIAVSGAGQPTRTPFAVDAALEQRASAATRGGVRVSPTPAPPAKSGKTAASSVKASSAVPRNPEPITGLSQIQMNNAAVIVQVAQEQGLPRRAMMVALMTGLQESSLRNLANPSVPTSLDQPNEGSGSDFDSLGIFQQRPSQGWGTVKQLMNPRYAADAFYGRLIRVTDWESMSLADAAQAVQVSAVPDAYAGHEQRASKLIDALL